MWASSFAHLRQFVTTRVQLPPEHIYQTHNLVDLLSHLSAVSEANMAQTKLRRHLFLYEFHPVVDEFNLFGSLQ